MENNLGTWPSLKVHNWTLRITLIYVMFYFREYKYQPYNSVIGLYRLGVLSVNIMARVVTVSGLEWLEWLLSVTGVARVALSVNDWSGQSGLVRVSIISSQMDVP